MTAGGAVSAVQTNVGDFVGARGTVEISGANSTYTNSGQLLVGRQGTGEFTVSGGGSGSSGTTTVGSNSTGAGTLTITGPGSRWSAATSPPRSTARPPSRSSPAPR